MSIIPVLTTERLILRAHEGGDLPAAFATWSDPRVVRHIGGETFNRTQCWSRILNYRGLWDVLGFGYWAVTDRESGTFLGDVGFADFKREIEPSIEGMAEAGWVLSPQAEGRGYATEAVTAALTWYDETFPGREAVCIIAPDNKASMRVAEKCGFRRWTETTFKGDPTVMFRRPAGGDIS